MLDSTIPATNFRAEQALRTPIVNRKVFGCNHADAGATAQAITNSTIQTCQQQSGSPFAFVRDMLCGVVQSLVPTMPAILPMPS